MKKVIFEEEVSDTVKFNDCNIRSRPIGVQVGNKKYFTTDADMKDSAYQLVDLDENFKFVLGSCVRGQDTQSFLKDIKIKFPLCLIYEFNSSRELLVWLLK
jgi:hypothetical protein